MCCCRCPQCTRAVVVLAKTGHCLSLFEASNGHFIHRWNRWLFTRSHPLCRYRSRSWSRRRLMSHHLSQSLLRFQTLGPVGILSGLRTAQQGLTGDPTGTSNITVTRGGSGVDECMSWGGSNPECAKLDPMKPSVVFDKRQVSSSTLPRVTSLRQPANS